MAKLEIFQNGTSMHPDTMGNPIYQIGSKNADGEYDVVVFDAMSEKEAKAKLKELNPVKAAPKPKPKPEPKPEIKRKILSKRRLHLRKKIVSKKSN